MAVDQSLYNEDLAPIPLERRTWKLYNYASLWVAMSVCIPTYMLASGLIAGGMNWWQAIGTILLGNLVVLIPMLLNAHAGPATASRFQSSCEHLSASAAQTFPRFCEPWSRADGSESRPGSAGRRFSRCFASCGPPPRCFRHLDLLFLVLGAEYVRHLARNRDH